MATRVGIGFDAIDVNTYWNKRQYWTISTDFLVQQPDSKILVTKDDMDVKRLIVLLVVAGHVLARDVVVYKTKKEADEQFDRARIQGQLLVD